MCPSYELLNSADCEVGTIYFIYNHNKDNR